MSSTARRVGCVALALGAPAFVLAQQADLALGQRVSDPAPAIGSEVTFTLLASNAGPQPATGVRIRDRLPGGYAYVRHEATHGAYDVATGRWTLGLPANGSAILRLVATVQPTGNRRNVGEVMAAALPDPDSTPGNGDPTEDDYAARATVPRPRPPNVVVVMLDDLDTRSLDDLLAAGLMPNLREHVIDRAVAFENAWVTTPLCCPSRATFLTGDYGHNTGILSNLQPIGGDTLLWAVGAFDDSDTLATRLQAAGYTTALIGKYLNGYGASPDLANISPAYDPAYVPPGWSHWDVLVDPSTYCVYNYTISHDGVTRRYQRPPGQREDSATYQTNVLADLSASFVAAHADDAAPFFLWVAPAAPHTEECPDAYGGSPPPDRNDFAYYIRPAPEFAQAPVPAFVPTPAYDEDLADKPGWLELPPLDAADLANLEIQYATRLRSVLSADVLIGRIVAALGDAMDETVLILTSDNGWFYGEHRRTEKTLVYREASRVPLYVALPGASAAQTRANLTVNNDLAPTILNLAVPGYGDADFDGRSVEPLLHAAAPPGWTDRAHFLIEYGYFLSAPGGDAGYSTYLALRNPATLYIESYAGPYQQAGTTELWGVELYDLAADPDEMSSLLHFPEDARHPVYGPWLDLLETCAGASCKLYENGLTNP
jgi:N-acetylglucosamine-6-sulfatase